MAQPDLCIQFFTTEGCHLCENAMLLLQEAQEAKDTPEFEIALIEISENEALLESYGVRIPVLKKNTDASELAWPFDLNVLKSFLSEYS